MKPCSELLQVYSNFAKMVETQFSKRIKIFLFDNALVTMFGNNIGSISTFKLSVPGFFNVTKLSYNLFSVGQLTELSYYITFDYSRCTVQDLRMGQELETGLRVGRMFLLDNLCLPHVAPAFVVAAVSSISSLALWHARLGYASSSWV